MAWAILYTKPREENRALENLASMDLEVICPRVLVERVKAGKLCHVQEPLFPRYIFVRNNNERFKQLVSQLRFVRGVSRLVSFGNNIASLDESTMQQIQARESKYLHIPIKKFRTGEAVTFTHGPFREIDAIFCESDGTSRALLIFELLSRKTRLSVPITAVSKT